MGLWCLFPLRVLALDSSGFPQSKPMDDSRLLYDVPSDDPVRSRPMPPCCAHEPPDAGTTYLGLDEKERVKRGL